MQQNAQCNKTPNYKTPNVTKRPMEQKAHNPKKPSQIQKNCKILKSRILEKLKFCELKGVVLFQG